MTIKIEPEQGMTTITQWGVRFPSGTIVWEDLDLVIHPRNASHQTFVSVLSDNTGRDRRYSLKPEHDGQRDSFTSLVRDFENEASKLGFATDETLLVRVKRQVRIIADEHSELEEA